MHIDNLAIALMAFDEALDTIAKGGLRFEDGKLTWNGNPGLKISINDLTAIKPDENVIDVKEITMKDNRMFKDIIDDIKYVIFNEPATIVQFKDGSKVCVKACENDTFNKEVGLIHAIVKRMYANDVDANGYLKSKGLGEKISKILANATDQKKVNAERRKLRKEKAAKKLEAQNKANNQEACASCDGCDASCDGAPANA